MNPEWFKDLELLQQLYLHENAIDPRSVDDVPAFFYCRELKVLTLYRQGANHLCEANLTGLPAVCKIWFTIHVRISKK